MSKKVSSSTIDGSVEGESVICASAPQPHMKSKISKNVKVIFLS